MATATAPGPRAPTAQDDLAALREEHDRLAGELAARKSIDDVRRGSYTSFLAIVTGGLCIKFAWDRWGFGPHRTPAVLKFPLLFTLALVATLACAALAARAFSRARRLMRVEDRDFARLRHLRERLGIEP
jgi:hypothetical protein